MSSQIKTSYILTPYYIHSHQHSPTNDKADKTYAYCKSTPTAPSTIMSSRDAISLRTIRQIHNKLYATHCQHS